MSTDFEKLGVFYLGKGKEDGTPLLYDAKDLVTHAVCVGMTGSGKTGLCIDLLEEAAIDGIPAIAVDPKGDLSNLLLGFPNLAPGDFEPWINADEARTQGLDPQTYAAQQAELWRTGLAKWGQDGARIQRLRDAADFSIYTPASSAGLPISILKSLAAPPEEVREDREIYRELIAGVATSLLGIVGVNADPLKSREHILLSALLEKAWSAGTDVDLAGLIGQIQQPPVAKLGVMDVDTFFPAKERFELAMQFNNLLASPGFSAWLEGEPLDIDRLLWTPQGKPRITIFSIAHLSDAERMFFVSLLLNRVLTWVRTQSGTTSLRAIFYMDEIYGYFPPVAEPPSKKPMLTLLKQARAFGLGMVLATQNPMDLDYKGLANTGTWFIGRLQTENDMNRLIDGLLGAGANVDAADMRRQLGSLGKRIFLLNNIHESKPVTFETRWALSYLRGPLTRAQIKLLMASKRGTAPPTTSPAAVASGARPVLPPEIKQFFVPSAGQATYEPRLLAAADVHFLEPKKGIDEVRKVIYLAPITDTAVAVDWSQAEEAPFALEDLENEPAEGARFAALPDAADNVKSYATWQKAFSGYLFQSQTYELYSSPSLKESSKPGESERDFRVRLQQIARERRDEQLEALRRKYAPKQQTLQDRRLRAQQAVEREKQQSQGQILQSAISVGSAVLGAFLGRKTFSATNIGKAATAAKSISKTAKESGDVRRAGETVENIEQEIAALEQQLQADIAAAQAAADPQNETFDTVVVKPKKANITVTMTALVWTC